MDKRLPNPLPGIRSRLPGGSAGPDRTPSQPEPAPHMGLRARWFLAFFGVPHGPVGWVGARLLPIVARRLYQLMADELDLQPEDELLDVGCGSAALLAGHATHVRYVAGLDASELQVGLARDRLRERIAAGTAEVVAGDATALPWPDARFTAVVSLNCLKFIADPERALQEMRRVLRPGGRVVLTLDPAVKADKSGRLDAYGEYQWSAEDARRLMQEAGFTGVSVRQLAAKDFKMQLIRGVKPA